MNASFYGYIGIVTKNLGEDLFKIFEVLIAVYAGVQVAKGAARGIKGLRKQVDDTIELSSRDIDGLDAFLIIPEDLRRFIKSARPIDDVAPKIIKNVETGIKKEIAEFGFIWNEGKGFKNSGPFTSGLRKSVKFTDAFGKGKRLTKQRLRSLKNTIIAHNHPNSSRFSNGDIKSFLELDLQELRAIGKNGVVYSLKRKTKIDESVVDDIIFELENQVDEIISDLRFQNINPKKIEKLVDDFEEVFLLKRINEFVEYTVFQ